MQQSRAIGHANAEFQFEKLSVLITPSGINSDIPFYDKCLYEGTLLASSLLLPRNLVGPSLCHMLSRLPLFPEGDNNAVLLECCSRFAH